MKRRNSLSLATSFLHATCNQKPLRNLQASTSSHSQSWEAFRLSLQIIGVSIHYDSIYIQNDVFLRRAHQLKKKIDIMVAMAFVLSLLALSAYGKSFLRDLGRVREDVEDPLSLGRPRNKLPLQGADSGFVHMSRQNVKNILSRTVLKQWQLPKLTFTDVGAESNEHSNQDKLKQLTIKGKTPLAAKNSMALPKLTAGKPSLTAGMPRLTAGMPRLRLTAGMPSLTAGMPRLTGQASRKTPVFGSEFMFLKRKQKPTWLMSTKDLYAETCRMNVYNQTISSKGCESQTILNKYCTGRCNSFFVPSPEADFQSCASCFPSRVQEERILLKCPKRKRGFKVKRVQMVLECKCQTMMSCKPLWKWLLLEKHVHRLEQTRVWTVYFKSS